MRRGRVHFTFTSKLRCACVAWNFRIFVEFSCVIDFYAFLPLPFSLDNDLFVCSACLTRFWFIRLLCAPLKLGHSTFQQHVWCVSKMLDKILVSIWKRTRTRPSSSRMIDKLPTSDCAQNPVGAIKAFTSRLNILVTEFITSHWQLISFLALITP